MHQASQAVLKRKTQKELQQEKELRQEKRLGAISKQAKEAKHLEREAQVKQSAETEVENNTDNKYTSYFVGGLVVVGTVSYLYLNKDKLISQVKRGDKKRLPTILEEEEILLRHHLHMK